MPRAPVSSSGERLVVALDNGSGSFKIGIAGEEEPRGTMPSFGLEGAGDARPMANGMVQDWDAMEMYWDHAFTNLLGVDTEQCNIITTAHLFESKDNRERLLQSLFESFAAPAVFLSAPPVFELCAAGRESGVVVGCGAQCTYAVLVHEGLPDPRTALRSGVTGDALTGWTGKRLAKQAGSSLTAAEAQLAKEALGVVALDGDGSGASSSEYTLPDGRKLKVDGAEREALAAPLFEPSLLGESGGGLTQLVDECIRLRDRDGAMDANAIGDCTGHWYGSVVLAGGSSLFTNLPDRLTQDLQLRAPGLPELSVCASTERAHAAWLGASILGSLAVMKDMWITKEEYDENGPLIVHRKCF